MKNLTERQAEILSYISTYMLDNGRSPTLQEIGNQFGFSAIAARDAVNALIKKGYLEKKESSLRSISFPYKERIRRENLPIPFYNSEPSFSQLESGKEDHTVFIHRFLAERNAYAFRITSESMRNAGILPGDIAVMLKADGEVKNDDIILASYGDDDKPMELRRFHPIGSLYAELWPDNDTMGIIKVMKSNIVVAGILAYIWRNFTKE